MISLTKSRNLFLIGFIAICMFFVAFVGLNQKQQPVFADTALNVTVTTWSGNLTCNNDLTITDPVTVTSDETATLNIAKGKTLTLQNTLTVESGATLNITGLGKLIITKEVSDYGVLNIEESAQLNINNGYVEVNGTGNSEYAVFADDLSTITLNATLNDDGVFVVNGGKSAGIKAHNIVVNRGLLRVHSTGTDDTETYGILMDSLTVGVENNYQYHPTIEVIEPSTNSIGISNPDYLSGGSFYYYGGSFEITASKHALSCHSTSWTTPIQYSGQTKQTATTGGAGADAPYFFVTHDPWNVRSTVQTGGYGVLVKNGLKQEMVAVNPVHDVAKFQGRTSVNGSLTVFDRIIMDMFCIAQYGPYGMVKDLEITGGDASKMTETSTGITIDGPFLETVTMSGKYTYYDVSDYAEKPFEITFTVATEITSSMSLWGGQMICTDDVTIPTSVNVSGSSDLYIPAGKTLTISSGIKVRKDKALRFFGQGNLKIIKDGSIASEVAFKLYNGASFILNDGYVDAVATGKCSYCVLADDGSTITINDGAFVATGGKSAGIKAHDIDLNRGLLRVHSTGTDDVKTYGILMDSLTVGDSGDKTYRPTLEVVEPSTNSIGIGNPDPLNAGSFRYDCGFVEVFSNTKAFDIHYTMLYDTTCYGGENKESSVENATMGNSRYYFITHADWSLSSETDDDFCVLFNDGRKQDGIYITPTGKTFSFEGRESVTDDLTDFDQFIKDFFYPILDGPYGIVKDIAITGGNGKVVGTDTGFSVSAVFNGSATISGKYTYFDGTEYQEKAFTLGLTISAGPVLTYEADGSTLTATYGTLGTYDLTLVAPTTNLVYDSTAKTATIASGYDADFFPDAEIQYFKNNVEVSSCINAGNYVAKVSYGEVSAEVAFTVAKATPTYTVPTNLSATAGNNLSSVALPSGWTWKNASQSVGEVGNHTFKATFTPTDTENYLIVDDIDVDVNVHESAPVAEPSAGSTTTTSDEHTFCVGWIVLGFVILELLYLVCYLIIRLCSKKKVKNIDLFASFAIFVFALISGLIHTCVLTIVGLICASLILAAFDVLWLIFMMKKQREIKEQDALVLKNNQNEPQVQETKDNEQNESENTKVKAKKVVKESEQDKQVDSSNDQETTKKTQTVVFAEKKSLSEKYAELPRKSKKIYDKIKSYAKALDGVKASETQNYFVVSLKKDKIVRLKIKKSEIVAEFFANDAAIKELAGVKVKESTSAVKVKTEEDVNKVIEIIDYKFKSLKETK